MGAALGVGQRSAGARVPAVRIGTVRRLRRLADLAARAEALVDHAGLPQSVNRLVIEVEAFRLANDHLVPIEADAAQGVELIRFVFGRRRDSVEVLHAHDEPTAGAASHQPGDQCRPQVSEVQWPGWRWSKPSAHDVSLAELNSRRTLDGPITTMDTTGRWPRSISGAGGTADEGRQRLHAGTCLGTCRGQHGNRSLLAASVH